MVGRCAYEGPLEARKFYASIHFGLEPSDILFERPAPEITTFGSHLSFKKSVGIKPAMDLPLVMLPVFIGIIYALSSNMVSDLLIQGRRGGRTTLVGRPWASGDVDDRPSSVAVASRYLFFPCIYCSPGRVLLPEAYSESSQTTHFPSWLT